MAVPAKLQAIIDSFKQTPKALRLHLLLDYTSKVPPLPPHLAGQLDAMEQVHECQTPLFVATEVHNGQVTLHFYAPEEAPTTRGFAGILSEGLNGLSPQEVLDTPDQFYTEMGLAEVISPLRVRGMAAILARLKRQLRDTAGDQPAPRQQGSSAPT